MKRRLGKQERCGAAPATMTRNSGEVGHDYGVGKLAKVLTYSTIGSARRWGRSRRTRRSYGEGVVRVDAAVSKLYDGAVGSAMAERLSLLAARWKATGVEKLKWRVHQVGGREFKSWPAAPGWPWHVACASGDRRRVAPRGIHFLKTDRHCSCLKR